jgi:hypothetical protein
MDHPTPAATTAVLQAWLSDHPRYAYSVDAYERAADGTESKATFRVTYDATSKVETVHVTSGRGAGTDLRWTGGSTVDVRGPGLAHMITLHLDVRAPQILSLLGNDMRTAALASVTDCYAADVAHEQMGGPADALTLTDNNPQCGPAYGTTPISMDRLTFDPDGHPIMRERSDGTNVVERWTIHDLVATAAPIAVVGAMRP